MHAFSAGGQCARARAYLLPHRINCLIIHHTHTLTHREQPGSQCYYWTPMPLVVVVLEIRSSYIVIFGLASPCVCTLCLLVAQQQKRAHVWHMQGTQALLKHAHDYRTVRRFGSTHRIANRKETLCCVVYMLYHSIRRNSSGWQHTTHMRGIVLMMRVASTRELARKCNPLSIRRAHVCGWLLMLIVLQSQILKTRLQTQIFGT